ncbi:MBL fold metallo-hydrolase [Nocardia mexicana]|uniref:Glyoxylase-like metal-dependent hydrolase (Beta-lactamase superfamily II) n=1 Tax=Nocardia mexicana TaxID=279262 RepID=A0A370H6S7_9NOCA|nr:MBL fold metallo-hydrolase [Nocardia mexicana]RDI51655.1 glyoxylase-like metal-dependent hydrolase (beta-lactamase superfamily II) [Nocardia mexicana]
MKIEQVSDSVHVVAGTNVNWALVSDGSGVTLIDAGYPADTGDVLGSVRQIGHRLTDIAAVLITHAHLDHIGAIPALVERVGMPVYAGAEEVRHAKREYLQQITLAGMVRQLTTRRGRRWVAHTLRAIHGHVGMAIPSATTGDATTLAALPGGLVAIPTPGHTSGHTAYLLPSEAVLFSGDALVTGHPLLRDTGPQLLPTVFNHDETRTRDSAVRLCGQPARTLVPGHGPSIDVEPGRLQGCGETPSTREW